MLNALIMTINMESDLNYNIEMNNKIIEKNSEQ